MQKMYLCELALKVQMQYNGSLTEINLQCLYYLMLQW